MITVVESGGQFQVVVGDAVPRVYAELGGVVDRDPAVPPARGNLFNRFIALISSIFLPILWPLAGTGLLKALLTLVTTLGWLDPTSQTYTILFSAADALFYFLPLLLAVTASRRFKADTFTSMAIAGALVYPGIIGLTTAGAPVTFFGIPVVLFSYVSSVIPIVVAVWVQSHLERLLKRVLPGWLRNFMTPMLVVLIMVPLILITIGPISSLVGQGISAAITGVWTLFPPFGPIIGGAVLGGLVQVFVLFGVHWGFIAVMANEIATNGFSLLSGPLVASVAAQAAAALGVFIRTRNRDLRALAGPAFISAVLAGITEPAIYGVNLRLKRPFVFAIIGGAVGGAIASSGGSAANAFVLASLMALPAYLTIGNFALQVIGVAVAMAVALGLTLTFGFKDLPRRSGDDQAPALAGGTVVLAAPISGRVIPVEEVSDQVFASGVMGRGIGIVPDDGRVYAPCDGTIVSATDTHHAFGLLSSSGVELLIHVGIDTVRLNGEHFVAHVATGDVVREGDLIVEVDLEAVQALGFDPTTVLVVTNSDDFAGIDFAPAGSVGHGETILTTSR